MSARCAHWIGAERRYCGAKDNVRPFLVGLCCPLHTPNALRGLPEPEARTGMPVHVDLPATVRATPADRRPLTAVPDPT
jgi:hypothetical protein